MLLQRYSSRGASRIEEFMGPIWGPPGSCWPQMGPMLVPWTLLSGGCGGFSISADQMKFRGPAWGPSGSCRPRMGPMLAPWTLLSGSCGVVSITADQMKFMGPTWGPPGSCRPQMGPMLVPWTLLSGSCGVVSITADQMRLPILPGSIHYRHKLETARQICLIVFTYSGHVWSDVLFDINKFLNMIAT